MKIDYKKLTWRDGYQAHLGLVGDRRCVIPQEVAMRQEDYNGRTFRALRHDGRWMRVRLVGSDYGLDTTGTGDIIVRPVKNL